MISEQQRAIILEVTKRINPTYVGIFGSFARDEQNENSDMDILPITT